MHIPDGILSAPILGGFGLASGIGVLISAKRAESSTQPHRLPLLGVLGAFVFAAQMVNFPVGPGASGHLLGGALLAATIGPWAASVTMTAILIVQALLFQDGGVLALTANVFNMAFLGVWSAWLPFRSLSNKSLGLFLGAFLSVLLSALLALTEVSLSSGVMTQGLWLFCLALFTVTGLIEATITLAAWQAIERLAGRSTSNPKPLRYALLSLSVVILFTGVFFASSAPDVLEYFQNQSGIAPTGAPFPALMPDYEWALSDLNWLRKSAASLAGLLAVFGLSVIISRFVPRGQQ
jgi:cobalt/nickel transport system permease protein